jgi:hypothetical protein
MTLLGVTIQKWWNSAGVGASRSSLRHGENTDIRAPHRDIHGEAPLASPSLGTSAAEKKEEKIPYRVHKNAGSQRSDY